MFMRFVFFVFVVLGLNASAWAASVKDGIFTQTQADRGQPVILDWCAHCHSPTLLGGENDTPPLVGNVFLDKWKGKTLGELFEKMRTTMPVDDPGKLSRTEYLFALAYILRANNFPVGAKPLPSDAKSLEQIEVVAP